MLDGVGPTPCAGSGRWGLRACAKLESLGVPAPRGFTFVKTLQNPSHEKTRIAWGSRAKVLTHRRPHISSTSAVDGYHRCGTETSSSSGAIQGSGGADQTPTDSPREEEHSVRHRRLVGSSEQRLRSCWWAPHHQRPPRSPHPELRGPPSPERRSRESRSPVGARPPEGSSIAAGDGRPPASTLGAHAAGSSSRGATETGFS